MLGLRERWLDAGRRQLTSTAPWEGLGPSHQVSDVLAQVVIVGPEAHRVQVCEKDRP